MSVETIRDLDKLLGRYVGQNKKITDVNIRRLTAVGENYGSILLKVDVTLKNDKNGTEEELYAVAKCLPSDEMFRKIFNVQVSCKVEIAFYDTMVPTLQQFQMEKGVQNVIDFFPRMYAHRINMNGSDIVDDDAVLLLENVAEAGYKNVSRFEGYDLPTVQVILRDLAAFHAVPLALKLLEPATFDSKIKPYLKEFSGPPSDPKHKPGLSNILYEFLESVDECKFLVPHLREVENTWRKGRELQRHEPFVSLGHGDLWINNIMTKFENSKPVSNKFVDFQTPQYQSPAIDLFFFLWSSVQKDVLEHHLDGLIQFYYNCFIDNLRQLQCDSSFFTLEVLLDELKFVSKTEVMHVLFMTTFIIFFKADKDDIHAPFDMKAEDIPKVAKERVKFMLKTCVEKGWLWS